MEKKTPEELLKERLRRLDDLMNLREPERVPFMYFTCGHLYAKWFKLSDVYFNFDVLAKAVDKALTEFPPDIFVTAPAAEGFIFAVAFNEFPDLAPAVRFLTGPMHDILGDRYTRWPGRELADHLPFQFLGGEFMKPEEYRKLAENPVEFIVNEILPRVCTKLGRPGTRQFMGTVARWGAAAKDWLNALNTIAGIQLKHGIPPLAVTFAYSPLDFIGDFLRHPTGAMIDLRRYPDLIKNVLDVLIEPILKVGLALKGIANFCFIPLHLNEMLPPKMYSEFYWPGLKKVITELLNHGIKSFILFEGDHTPHLDTLLELPKGWGIGVFEKGDIKMIKKKLEGHTIVAGGLSNAFLISATPEKIEEYVKNLLKDVAPGGGFILAPGVAEVDPAVPDVNLKAVINTVLKYGTRR